MAPLKICKYIVCIHFANIYNNYYNNNYSVIILIIIRKYLPWPNYRRFKILKYFEHSDLLLKIKKQCLCVYNMYIFSHNFYIFVYTYTKARNNDDELVQIARSHFKYDIERLYPIKN